MELDGELKEITMKMDEARQPTTMMMVVAAAAVLPSSN